MAASVDNIRAVEVLEKALNEASAKQFKPSSELRKHVEAVILGSHLTYRYILVTGLLAKATNVKVNPLALQAGADIQGAYDARSLCHSVLVPFERSALQDRLGGSNEPFLNKPARFTTLSMSNAVRRGGDRKLLETSIAILSSVSTSSLSYRVLCDALYFILQRPPKNIGALLSKINPVQSSSGIMKFVLTFLGQSCGGEAAALVAGAAFEMLNETLDSTLDITVHPVNQSGASSREISDIDIYRNNRPFSFVEVKDKAFIKEDVGHAISKVAQTGHNSLLFLIGPRGRIENVTCESLVDEWKTKGIDLIFYNLEPFVLAMLAINPDRSLPKFLGYINDHCKSARIKDETLAHLINCTENCSS